MTLSKTDSQSNVSIFLFGLFRINKQPSPLLEIFTLIQVYNMAYKPSIGLAMNQMHVKVIEVSMSVL